MRAIVGILRRSPCVTAAAVTFAGRLSSILLEGLGSPRVGSCGTRMELTRDSMRSCPLNAPVRFSSSDTTVQTIVPACPDPSGMVKEIAEYVAYQLQINPHIMEFAVSASTIFFFYRILPELLVKIKYQPFQCSEYEKCLRIAWSKTERHILHKQYPAAALGLFFFSQMSTIIAPSMKVYIPYLWESASMLHILWSFNLLKENFIAEAKKKSDLIDCRRLSHFDKVFSVGLIGLGFLGIGEVGGLSLQSLVTISGAGGVLTAFAARDVLGNMLSGFSLHLTEPFKVGEYIKAGSVEGTVVEIGLTCTSLINQQCLPVTVPNSYFGSQVVVNKSRATVLSIVVKIPLKVEDVDKLQPLTREVTQMLKNHSLIRLAKETPCCHISRVGKLYGELMICLETENKNGGLKEVEQTIMLETLKIMRSIGVEVGDALPSGELEALLEAAEIIKSRGTAYAG